MLVIKICVLERKEEERKLDLIEFLARGNILIGVSSALKNEIKIRHVNLSSVKIAILEESYAILKEQLGLRKYRRVLLFTKPIADDAPKRVIDDIDKYVDAVYGYCKYHNKTAKTGQTWTRDEMSTQEPGAC
ncbi:hypothetical protein Tco_1164425 [Tanacetum coccineum]